MNESVFTAGADVVERGIFILRRTNSNLKNGGGVLIMAQA